MAGAVKPVIAEVNAEKENHASPPGVGHDLRPLLANPIEREDDEQSFAEDAERHLHQDENIIRQRVFRMELSDAFPAPIKPFKRDEDGEDREGGDQDCPVL